MKRFIARGLLLLFTLPCLVACSKREPAHGDAAGAPGDAVSFTSTNQVVAVETVKLKKDRYVEVDLNADGLADLAVIEDIKGTDEGPSTADASAKSPQRLAIYVRKTDTEYYICGYLVDIRDADIIGLAFRKSPTGLFDIVMVNKFPDGRTDVVQYVNEGSRLVKLGGNQSTLVSPPGK